MATIEELDIKIAEKRRQIAQYENRKKAILAKQREQERKWKSGITSSVGEMILNVTGSSWTEIDYDGLYQWLMDHKNELMDHVVTAARPPAEAKSQFDAFKHQTKETAVDNLPESDEARGW